MRTALCSLLLGLAAPALALPLTNVYFFGDSLTDTGNVQEVYAPLPKPPGAPLVVPGAPYDPGGRASNGPVYADVLAAGLGFSALASARGGDNFAFGGARTRYQLFGPPFLGIIDQVAAFNARPGPADPNALYVLWAGSNNLQDIFLGRTTDALGNPIPNPPQTLGDIQLMISNLYAEGARTLLVPNVPDLSRVPRLTEVSDPATEAMARMFVQSFNAGFDATLNGIEAALPDLRLIRFDSFAAFNDIILNPGAFGITNTTDRCYTGDDLSFTGGGTVCANPDEFFYWDGIHPTTAVHQELGRRMLAAVLAATVPEPSPLALIALFLALGWASVRRSDARKRAARIRPGALHSIPAG
jgi:phospholipase/lecithinase/hemolysin